MRIKDWHKFQHFKDRKPPWIKLYRDLLDDLQWHELDPQAAKILVMLWLIGSENDGNLPDTHALSFRLRISEKSLEATISKLGHWIIQDDIAAISPSHPPVYVSDYLERETEKETEREGDGALTPIPKNFKPADQTVAWAKEQGHSETLPTHLAHFVLTCKANGYQKADWDAFFMKAIRDNWAKVDKPRKIPDTFNKTPLPLKFDDKGRPYA